MVDTLIKAGESLLSKNKFALLVPCYNAEKYIDGFVDNLSKLTQPFDEILFYDDGSSDGTYHLLVSKGLEVIKGDGNKGAGYARNKLAGSCTCEWFHFHDIDDRLASDYLAKTAAAITEHPLDVVLCNVDWYDAQTNALILNWTYSNKEINEDPIAYTVSHPIGGINGLYRKSKFLESGGFNTSVRIWEDADMHVTLAAHGARFFIVEEVLSWSLRYENSASSDQVSGWLTRLSLLQAYGEKFSERSHQQAIGEAAQITASKLIMSRQPAAAKRALQLSEQCGVQVPDNQSKIWHLMKAIFPGNIRIALRLLQLKRAFKTDGR